MAWSFTDVSSDYQTWLALDYPLLAVQTIPVSPSHKKWVDDGQVGAGDVTTWTDRSATASPSYRAYDGYPGYITEHSGVTADDVYYLAFDMGSAITFDCAFLIGHNALSLNPGCTLEISDDNAFTTSVTEIGDFGTLASTDRIALLSLAHAEDLGRAHDTAADAGPNQYTARYLWLKFDNAGNGNIVPEVGELILGKRYQCSTNPVNPYDNISLHDEVSRSRTMGGVTHSTIHHQNRHDLVAEFLAWQDARIADFKSWFKAARGNFVFIDEPSTAPNSWRMISKPTDLDMPSAEYTERSVRIFGEEQGSESYFLENE